MKKEETRTFLALLAVLFLGCMTAVLLRPKKTEPISRSDFLLNTFVTVTLYDTEDESLLDSCMELCRMYESRFSKTISTSEIYQMNHRQPEETTFSLSQDTADLIREGLEYSRLSDGAFDITIEPLSSLWDFTSGEAVIPEESAIQAATARVDYRNLVLDGNTLTFLSPDTTIDLGSIAKGFIADRLKEYLVGQGVKSAIINLGGNVLCIGEQPDGSPFLIGLQAPFEERNTIYANLEIHDLSVVSSGVYERHFVVDGKNYHHLLNPKTGYPYDNGLISVTILSSRSVDGDALSTTCFSLGLDKGLALVNSLDGIDAFFMTEDKEVHYSDGAEAFLR
ncbi:MAG: FAD:protein FMN transferase [Otoolea sp.]